MSDALGLIGIARMGGNIETGEDNAKAVVKAGKARLLIVASDTSPAAKRRAEGYVYGFSTPLTEVPFTKEEISAAAGRHGCSMAAFLDLGLAYGFAAALYRDYGEPYRLVAEELEKKRERAAARRGGKTGKRRKRV